ncbi:enoyl-CoA hydratase (plasmid) [Rhizobium sp. ACO-34A]|nr:crotonase/enoyl-CoA hydratase family protein [Rhizobium sp. ACO-34A]ATN36853.1 enoyl-CoA hydratase [Rhizobium sp. ACO-34A]
MELVHSSRDEAGVVTMTLSDPASRNAISGLPMVEALLAALATAEADPKARVIVLTGEGPAFSAGGNIKAMGEGQGLVDAVPAITRQNYRNGIQRLPVAFEALELPVIAAVNGPAIGAGCDLALMCDIRIAGRSARFAESFVKLGIVPGDGGAWLLPRAVGFSKASEMALTGDVIDAEEALRIGMVSKVVEDGSLLDVAVDMARRIAANPTQAVRMTKRLLRQAAGQGLHSFLEMSAAMQAIAHHTEDYRIALGAMLDRTGKGKS